MDSLTDLKADTCRMYLKEEHFFSNKHGPLIKVAIVSHKTTLIGSGDIKNYRSCNIAHNSLSANDTK